MIFVKKFLNKKIFIRILVIFMRGVVYVRFSPFPISPALAASIEAFKESIFVCCAIELISPIMVSMKKLLIWFEKMLILYHMQLVKLSVFQMLLKKMVSSSNRSCIFLEFAIICENKSSMACILDGF